MFHLIYKGLLRLKKLVSHLLNVSKLMYTGPLQVNKNEKRSEGAEHDIKNFNEDIIGN